MSLVSRENAQELATRSLISVCALGGADSLESVRSLRTAKHAAEIVATWSVTDIFDIDELLLFRDLSRPIPDSANEAYVRTTVTDLFGGAIVSSGIRRATDLQAKVANAGQVASTRCGAVMVSNAIISYCYPKLGIKIKLQDGTMGIIDIHSGEIARLDGTLGGTASTKAWSPYKVWGPDFTILNATKAGIERSTFAPLRYDAPLVSLLSDAREYERAFTNSDALPESELAASGGPWMQLMPQEQNNYCAVASAQMILSFKGKAFTQERIAAAMEAGQGGEFVTPTAQVAAYQRLATGLRAEYDDTCSFSEVIREISADLPLKSGVPGHARVCTGWLVRRDENGNTKNWLRIFDPWPPGEGAVYWESGTSVVHTNYIYVR